MTHDDHGRDANVRNFSETSEDATHGITKSQAVVHSTNPQILETSSDSGSVLLCLIDPQLLLSVTVMSLGRLKFTKFPLAKNQVNFSTPPNMPRLYSS